jgi:glycosyltransferase involved in cell wall biosynthesis
MTGPEISCVIPTYERADLAARCLASVTAQREAAAEIIVTDDSTSSAIRDLVAALTPSALTPSAPRLRFLTGPRSGNPVDNWNAGLGEAQAPLQVLIHQDEHLIDPLYLRRAIDALNRTDAAATRAGVAVTGFERPSRFALVAPLAGRLWRARRLLPLINWIGPTAAFVFRTGPRFDPALVQLVDVEFYGRVLRTGPLARLPGLSVGSLGHHDGQISARIDRTEQALRELALLATRRPPAISPIEHAVFSTALRLRRRLG